MMQTGYCGEIALKDSKLKKTEMLCDCSDKPSWFWTVSDVKAGGYETERHELVLKAHIVKETGCKTLFGMIF